MPAEMAEVTQTHCPHCSLQCGIHLTARDDGVLDLEGRADFPVARSRTAGSTPPAWCARCTPGRSRSPTARARRENGSRSTRRAWMAARTNDR